MSDKEKNFSSYSENLQSWIKNWTLVVNEEEKHADGTTNKDVINTVAGSPVPVKQSSAGNDTTDPHSLGVTYTTQQIKDLADLKVQVHELQDKLNAKECEGKATDSIQKQITAINDKIEKLGSEMNKTSQASAAE